MNFTSRNSRFFDILELTGLVIDKGLRVILVTLMVMLFSLVIIAVFFRYSGNSLHFFDELAAMLLSWITYYGAALAALHGRHMATTSIVNAMPKTARILICLMTRALIITFLVFLAIMGFRVLEFISGMHLNSLPNFPRSVAQHVVPVGACLYILAELIRLPQSLREAAAGEIPASEG